MYKKKVTKLGLRKLHNLPKSDKDGIYNWLHRGGAIMGQGFCLASSIQGLYKFLGSKIQDFFQTFFQNNNFFFQIRLKVIKQLINTDLKKREQSFSHDAQQMYGRDWIRFDQNKIKFPLQTTCCTYENKLKTFHHFSRLCLHSPDFFQVWKIAGQISMLSQEFKTKYEP